MGMEMEMEMEMEIVVILWDGDSDGIQWLISYPENALWIDVRPYRHALNCAANLVAFDAGEHVFVP